MSAALAIEDAALDQGVMDEASEQHALSRALRLARGFKLVFARCNHPAQRQQVVAGMEPDLAGLTIEEIDLAGPIPHLLTVLRERLDGARPDAVFVSGLEYSLPNAAEAHSSPFVANLNASRNSFRRVVKCPLVLWVPEYILAAIARGAPDFFAIRSGVYYFGASQFPEPQAVDLLVGGEEWEAESLTQAEKEERVGQLTALLADYRALPTPQRDYGAEARLLSRLGVLHHALSDFDAAETAMREALDAIRVAGARSAEAMLIGRLANVIWHRGRWHEAEVLYGQSLQIARETGDVQAQALYLGGLGNLYRAAGRLDEAEETLERGLAAFRSTGDRAGEGAILNNLATVRMGQGRYKEAEQTLAEALRTFVAIGDRAAESRALGNLGYLSGLLGRLGEAEVFYQRALEVLQVVGDRAGEAQTLSNLAQVQLAMGRTLEGEALLQRSLNIARSIGDRAGEVRALVNLGAMHHNAGDLASAISLVQQSLSALSQLEDRQLAERVEEILAEWKSQLADTNAPGDSRG